MTEESAFLKVGHIGVIVRDLDRAVEYYESLGIGPFEPPQNVTASARKVGGKPIFPDAIKLKAKIAKQSPVWLQLIQPVEGESLFKEFLKTKGEGVNHLGFHVDDIEKEEARLVEKGLTVLYSSRFVKGGGVVNFDTRKVGGVLFELIQWPSE